MDGSQSLVPCTMYKVKGVKNRVRELLNDGKFHAKSEIKEHSGSKSDGSTWFVICCLRKELPLDQDILCEMINRTLGYRLVKLFCKRDRNLP